jgi:hypothetical protein
MAHILTNTASRPSFQAAANQRASASGNGRKDDRSFRMRAGHGGTGIHRGKKIAISAR